MTKNVYLIAPEGRVGKSAVALGVIEALSRGGHRVGVFRPIMRSDGRDTILETLVGLPSIRETYDEAAGVPYSRIHADPEEAIGEIIARYGALQGSRDAIVILGSDYADVADPTEFAFNAQVAAHLDAPAVLVIRGNDKTPDGLRHAIESSVEQIRSHHVQVVGVLATRLDHVELPAYQAALDGLDLPVVATIPEDRVLTAPTVRQLFEAARATVLQGSDEALDRESQGVMVAGMTLPNVLDRIFPEATMITASDRLDLLPGILLAQQSDAFPHLAGIVLVGGFQLPPQIQKLIDTIDSTVPIARTDYGTYTTAERLFGLEGARTSSVRKVEIARSQFLQYVDATALVDAIGLPRGGVRTPLMFEYQIMQTARGDKRTIVLPESGDDRILESASIILRRNVADIILLGKPEVISARAAELGLTLTRARVIDPEDPTLIAKFSAEYARLRAKKGVTLEQAAEKMKDLSYFGTMLVHFGLADGMVSGAINTTANTIRPSLEFVKTKPGVSVVSSSFLMCMPDRVLVFGDCAVNPDPTAEQLADIAISSAETAAAFGIEPRVAMLSYSTGTSGTGAGVDKVREATEIVRTRAPELKVDGPIQFDAAMDIDVARTKMPNSEVAGQATVFIFPDLNTGNNTYKAVQRTANAVAVGPVLQGLNKPVNDLSRGALVDDIVNTVAITAIQAQAEPAGQPSAFAQV